MPNTTGSFPMPYPNSTDVPDVPGDILELAQAVDDTLTDSLEGDGWVTPTLTNSWVSSVSPAYRVINNVVYLRGRITGGTTGTAFTLPVGARPTVLSPFLVSSGTGTTATTVTITTAGEVQCISGVSPNLATCSFPAT